MQNARLANKRAGYSQDIIIPKKAKIQILEPIPGFEHEPMEAKNIECTIGNLQHLKSQQLITIKAYVNCLTDVKQVTQKTTQQQVNVRECQVTDATGSTKLVLWGAFTSQVQNDKTYEFKNLRIKGTPFVYPGWVYYMPITTTTKH